MANLPTVQLIQDNSNAINLYFNWTTGGAALTGLTGILMPVLLYRGHSLITPIALGALVNGAAWGGGFYLVSRAISLQDRWYALDKSGAEPLDPADPQIAPYLARFPVAYEVVDIDRTKTSGAQLQETWTWAYTPKEVREVIKSRLKAAGVIFVSGVLLLLGSAGIGRLVQGQRPWQRWVTLISLATASVGSAGGLWGVKVHGERNVGKTYVRCTLGRLILAEALSSGGLQQATSNLARARSVKPWKFYRVPLNSGQQTILGEELRRHDLSVQYGREGSWVVCGSTEGLRSCTELLV